MSLKYAGGVSAALLGSLLGGNWVLDMVLSCTLALCVFFFLKEAIFYVDFLFYLLTFFFRRRQREPSLLSTSHTGLVKG